MLANKFINSLFDVSSFSMLGGFDQFLKENLPFVSCLRDCILENVVGDDIGLHQQQVSRDGSKQVHFVVDNSVSRKDPEYYVHDGTSAPVHTTSADMGSILTPYFASSLSFLRSLNPGASMPARVSVKHSSNFTEPLEAPWKPGARET